MKHFFIFLLVFNINFLYSEIEFRAATEEDIPGIIRLMNNEATCQNIYPTQRRKSAVNGILKAAIDYNNIFVAVECTTFCCMTIVKIIGFKKLCIHYQSSNISIEIDGCCNNKYSSSAINKGLVDLALNSLSGFKEKKDLSKICFTFKNSCKDEVNDSIKAFMDTVNLGRKHDQKVQCECADTK